MAIPDTHGAYHFAPCRRMKTDQFQSMTAWGVVPGAARNIICRRKRKTWRVWRDDVYLAEITTSLLDPRVLVLALSVPPIGHVEHASRSVSSIMHSGFVTDCPTFPTFSLSRMKIL